jgi:hemoglobin/transferrin/lactoferrin receptor protein
MVLVRCRHLPPVLAGAAILPAAAPAPPAEASATVVVTATRTERPGPATAATVDLLGRGDLDRLQAVRPNDLARAAPGVEVGFRPGRLGSTNFNIRGIDGNRVLVLVDGVPLPDGPEAGRAFTRDLVDLASVQRVEILRGPASALYGSDALGGVVSYATRAARDLVREPAGRAGSLDLAWTGADRGRAATVTAAGRDPGQDWLLLGTLRRSAGVRPRDGGGNPMAIRQASLLAKAGWTRNDRHRLEAGLQYLGRSTDVELADAVGPIPHAPVRVLASHGDDLARRAQFSLAHRFEDATAWFQHAEWRIFAQSAGTAERTREARETGAGPRLRASDVRFRQEVLGLRAQGERSFQAGGGAHRLLLGLDATRAAISRPYDRSETDPATGAVSATVAGQAYPVKVCPDSTTWATGIFVQDELADRSGRFLAIPGLRLDRYGLVPHPDADFQRAAAQDQPAVRITRWALTPRLALLAALTPGWTAYAAYAQGFRNPPYDQANIAFGNRTGSFQYQVLPNPGLGPERSRGWEAGLRGEGRGWSASLTGFLNQYRDFIERASLGPDPAGVHQFQYRNVQRVRIFGAEARAARDLGAGFRLEAAAAWAQGDDLGVGQPLASVAPARLVATLQARPGGWGADLTWTGVARKTRVPPPDALQLASFGAAEPFRAPGCGVVDLLVFRQAGANVRWSCAIRNLLDQRHWHWEDVRGLAAGDPAVDRAMQPGRNLTVTATVTWG